jgi:hypothetical protein
MLLACTGLAAADWEFKRHDIARLDSERIAGGALKGNTLAAWGDRLRWWSLPMGKSTVVGPPGPFAEGGAILDVDRDGRPDIVVNESSPGRALIWLHAPGWTRRVIDRGVDTADILPAVLFGRRGILVVHLRAQVRFYEIPPHPEDRWPMTEIYSFYTPADQGGLLLADIDCDGRPDIVCGNYWIRSPESFDLPWRLFAIELWNEQPYSAMLRLAFLGPRQLVATEREMSHARFSRFGKPADPKQLWKERPIADSLALDHPAGLDVADFDGDGRPDIAVGEQGGAGRLIIFRNRGGRFEPHVVATGVAALHLRAIRSSNRDLPDIVTLERSAVSVWRNHTRRR